LGRDLREGNGAEIEGWKTRRIGNRAIIYRRRAGKGNYQDEGEMKGSGWTEENGMRLQKGRT